MGTVVLKAACCSTFAAWTTICAVCADWETLYLINFLPWQCLHAMLVQQALVTYSTQFRPSIHQNDDASVWNHEAYAFSATQPPRDINPSSVTSIFIFDNLKGWLMLHFNEEFPGCGIEGGKDLLFSIWIVICPPSKERKPTLTWNNIRASIVWPTLSLLPHLQSWL